VGFAVSGIETKEDFQKFHRKNLDIIAQINAEFGLRDGIGGLMAMRRAKYALKLRVNEAAAQCGMKYTLEGRFMNIGGMPVEFIASAVGSRAKTG
jgi:hypothetical protein